MTPLDPLYFGTQGWAQRVATWMSNANSAPSATPFLDGNVRLIRHSLMHSDATGPRMVVNIGADALLSFLATGDYRNIYAQPVVGGKRRSPTKERVAVDGLLELEGGGANHYFGAVALDGTGVRFYGEYCMAIQPARVTADTRLFDRDSYDLLQAPLADPDPQKAGEIVSALRGQWGADLADMLIMKMLPRLPPVQHLITAGTISGLVLSDQEFVEVHLEDKILTQDIEEIRQSPDADAVEAGIVNRKRNRQSPTLVEMRWVEQRMRVRAQLLQQGVGYRVVTFQGRGYQWT
ncbi:MAG: hypothetical protein ABJA77_11200 [Variovorax sp.]